MGINREPNENWLQANQGDTIIITYPQGRYAVTVHTDSTLNELLGNTTTADEVLPADD